MAAAASEVADGTEAPVGSPPGHTAGGAAAAAAAAKSLPSPLLVLPALPGAHWRFPAAPGAYWRFLALLTLASPALPSPAADRPTDLQDRQLSARRPAAARYSCSGRQMPTDNVRRSNLDLGGRWKRLLGQVMIRIAKAFCCTIRIKLETCCRQLSDSHANMENVVIFILFYFTSPRVRCLY